MKPSNLSFGLFVMSLAFTASSVTAQVLSDTEQLGKSIFFDKSLSIEQNQSCASCHGSEVGWTGPIQEINEQGSVYEGSISSQFGDRKPPSSAYATQSPIFHVDRKGLFVGGNFWDGRATGEKLGNPAADQAQGPFLNPVEQALPDSACVVYRVCDGGYGGPFKEVWGDDTCEITWPSDVETTCSTKGSTVNLSHADRAKSDSAYDQVALSIASYESSAEVNAFSSKYDLSYTGKVKLTQQERQGQALFRGKGKCHLCHISNGKGALFTDYTFDNLGTPKNPENPVYDINPDFVDPGLGGFLKQAGYDEEVYEAEWGKQKVPTLRNVDKRPYSEFVKAYGHNGYFKSLKSIVHFYNTRDVKPSCESFNIVDATEVVALEYDCWPNPEVTMNVNTNELGNLGLTSAEEDAIVTFMKTLSDGYVSTP
ncbi:MAG: cytochrome C [Methyloprofundus sp.]|nr:cytochrome C [Methyloprofundus sp.]